MEIGSPVLKSVRKLRMFACLGPAVLKIKAFDKRTLYLSAALCCARGHGLFLVFRFLAAVSTDKSQIKVAAIMNVLLENYIKIKDLMDEDHGIIIVSESNLSRINMSRGGAG